MAAMPSAFNTTTSPKLNKSQQAYLWLRDKIRTRELEPGNRLVLAAIAEELNISVVPVREAIRQLEAEGLVTFEPNVGASVTTHNRDAYFKAMQTVAILEASATALSAPSLDAADIAAARELNERMRSLDVNHDPDTFTELNKQFHMVLCSRCPNERLLTLLHQEWEQLEYHRVSTFRYVPERALSSVSEHDQILAFIEAQAAPDYLERVCRDHRLKTSRTYQELFRQAQATQTLADAAPEPDTITSTV